MLEDDAIARLIPQIYRRLCMMPEEWAYEFEGPRENTLLQVSGGGNSPRFTLTPIFLGDGGDRLEGPAVTFMQYTEGVLEVAGKTYPNPKVVSVDDPTVELNEWLRSDPWSGIN